MDESSIDHGSIADALQKSLQDALSFKSPTGGSFLSLGIDGNQDDGLPTENGKTPSSYPQLVKQNRTVDWDQLDSPSDKLLEAITDTAALERVNSGLNRHKDDARKIIENILKVCFFFNVQDVDYIAYIFATITRETNFGRLMEEKNTPPLKAHFYEPVFFNANAIKKSDARFKKFNKSISDFLNKLGSLREDNAKGIKLFYQEINKAFEGVEDEMLKGYLAEIENKNVLNLIKVLLSKNISWENRKVELLVPKIRQDSIRKLNDTSYMLYGAKLKILLLDWLVRRIEISAANGNTMSGDGKKFSGRGFVQITGRAKYQLFTDLFNAKPENSYGKALRALGKEDMPDFVNGEGFKQAADPTISAVITVGGICEGKFAGNNKGLSFYTSNHSLNFFNARAIVNGDKNRPADKKHLGNLTVGEQLKNNAELFANSIRMNK